MTNDFLTTPLSDSILVAATLYALEQFVNAQRPSIGPGGVASLTIIRADLHHSFVRLTDIWNWFEDILESWGRTEQQRELEGAILKKDGLSLLEEARFLPVIQRFIEATQRDGEQLDLVGELEEFVNTSKGLVTRVEAWLRTENYC